MLLNGMYVKRILKLIHLEDPPIQFCPFRPESGMSSSQAHGTEPIIFGMHLQEMSCILLSNGSPIVARGDYWMSVWNTGNSQYHQRSLMTEPFDGHILRS